MNCQEHISMASKLLEDGSVPNHIAAAQVHATLAQVQATLALVTVTAAVKGMRPTAELFAEYAAGDPHRP